MRKLLVISISFYLLTSCVATHNGAISSSSINKPVKYEDISYGVSQTNRYFGIGGLSQDALVLEAKRELIKNRPLRANEEYANFTIDFKNTYFPFYFQSKVTMSADIVSFINDTMSDPYSNNYKSKLFGVTIANGLFNIGDSILDNNFREGIIISIESRDIVRIMYKTKRDKIRTKKISVNRIYAEKKKYNGLKTGDWYVIPIFDNGVDHPKTMKVVAVGLKSLIIEDTSSKKLNKIKYKK